MESARVYLGGVPDNLSGEEIYKHLSVYGRITEIKLRPGFGFVQFESPKDALDVVRTFSNRLLLGFDINVRLARPDRYPRYPEEHSAASAPAYQQERRKKMRYAVIVKGLNPRTCWQELKDFGRSIGAEVAFCDVDREHRTRGFINYLSEEDADLAVRELDGRELLGSVVQVYRQDAKGGEHTSREAVRSRSPSRTIQDSGHSDNHDPRGSDASSRYRSFSGSSDTQPSYTRYTPSTGGYPALFPHRVLPHEYVIAESSQASHHDDREAGTSNSWHFR